MKNLDGSKGVDPMLLVVIIAPLRASFGNLNSPRFVTCVLCFGSTGRVESNGKLLCLADVPFQETSTASSEFPGTNPSLFPKGRHPDQVKPSGINQTNQAGVGPSDRLRCKHTKGTPT